MWLLLAGGVAAASAGGAEVSADAPTDLSVTVYRSPYRRSGSIDLDRLGGFALISETRTVRLPVGMSRVRFEGVADGIEPASAIVTGLPEGIIERNREGALLSPSALMESAAGRPVTLLRSNPKTGKSERLPGKILADAGGGVVFETAAGIEALRCSGLAESFSFDPVADLSATPTLSVLVQSGEPVATTVTLSYLAHGFDWAADYTATLARDDATMDLGAWVTLANGNGVGFPQARTQAVAGRVNRESGEVEPLDAGGPILARCWPRGSTSDSPELLQIDRATPGGGQLKARVAIAPMALAAPRLADVMQEAQRVEQEQLGDLKLYRVPDRTTVASRQSKQVRLLDRTAIPIKIVYGADLGGSGRQRRGAGPQAAADHERCGQSPRIAAAVRKCRGICRTSGRAVAGARIRHPRFGRRRGAGNQPRRESGCRGHGDSRGRQRAARACGTARCQRAY